MTDRDYERERHFLHLDGFAFFGDVATALAQRTENLQKAAEEQAVAEWRAFMRTAPDEQEIQPEYKPFNTVRLAS